MIQLLFGALTWTCVRAGMQRVEADGDLSETGKRQFAEGMIGEAERWGISL